MPTLLDYSATIQTLQGQGFKSLYYNSGAFGFADPADVSYVGWIGDDDPTLRPQMRTLACRVSPPYPQTLIKLAIQAWQTYFPGPAWVMPLAHWSYELDFGSRDWLPDALRHIGVDPLPLQACSTGNALEFTPKEPISFTFFLIKLLENLTMSDFMIAFPGHPAICTVHHHKQLWWTSNDPALLGHLRKIAISC